MNAALEALRARWAAMGSREKLLVAVAAALIAIALVWMIAIGPALSTLRSSNEQRVQLDVQMQRMAALREQARGMQSQPRIGREEAVRQLELGARQRLGTSGRIVISGDRVTVTLTGTPADALAQWLAQARTAARALPGEARLTRNANGLWEGSMVLTLPRS